MKPCIDEAVGFLPPNTCNKSGQLPRKSHGLGGLGIFPPLQHAKGRSWASKSFGTEHTKAKPPLHNGNIAPVHLPKVLQ